MSAELGLAVIGVVDGCIKSTRLANAVISTYLAYRGAEDDIDDKFVLLEAIWTRVERQLTFLRKISDHLDQELARSFLHLLQKLNAKLLYAQAQLDTHALEAPSSKQRPSDFFKKLKFALVKKNVDGLMRELEIWRHHFDPTWYLIILVSSSVLDSGLLKSAREDDELLPTKVPDPLSRMLALRSTVRAESTSPGIEEQPRASIYRKVAGLSVAKETVVSFSTARVVSWETSGESFVAESIVPPAGSISEARTDAESLARKLQIVDPDNFGLLRCYGLVKHRDAVSKYVTAIDIIYRIPAGSKIPCSLRQLLLQQQPTSISAVVRMAKQLIRSVSYIHACGFVHKNIRPDNVLVFPGDASALGASFLIGLNQFRNANFQTNLSGDLAWNRNLYRHPQRQGVFVQERYSMQHDIYSLGVCLLEMGLWRSFVWYPGEGGDAASPVPGLSLGLSICNKDFETNHRMDQLGIKEHFVDLAKRELPSRLGDVYTGIVTDCLMCLDAGNDAFGGEMRDEDGIIVGLRFVERVLMRISEISI